MEQFQEQVVGPSSAKKSVVFMGWNRWNSWNRYFLKCFGKGWFQSDLYFIGDEVHHGNGGITTTVVIDVKPTVKTTEILVAMTTLGHHRCYVKPMKTVATDCDNCRQVGRSCCVSFGEGLPMEQAEGKKMTGCRSRIPPGD